MPKSRRLSLEALEDRSVPAVVLAPISAEQVSTTSPTYIPVTVTNTPAGPVTTTATSDNAGLAVSVIAPGRSVRFDVSGKTAAGANYSGSLTLRLFDDAAPLAAQRIVDLANSGFYNGKLFHRVIPDFVIQGGSPTGTGVGGSSLPDFVDEFSANYTFASNGVLAMANAGDDNNNSQFFITALDEPLARRAEFLNFNHSIFGILTEGFDAYRNTINTPRNSADKPLTDVVITSATVFNDRENAVLRLTPLAGFSGAANVAVSATDGSGAPFAESFAATATASTNNSRAFLNPPGALSTPANTPLTVQFSATDLERDPLTFAVRGTNFSGVPAGVTVSVNASTGVATFTPPTDFVGTVQFKVGVRDQTNRGGTGSTLDDASNYDTQLVTLTVTAPVRLNVPTSATTGQSVLIVAAVGPLQSGSTGGTVTFRTPSGILGTSAVGTDGYASINATFPTSGTVQVSATFTPAKAGEVGGEAVPATIAVSDPGTTAPPVTPPTTPPVTPPPTTPPPTTPPTTPPVVSVVGAAAGSAPTVSVTVNGVTSTFAAYEVTFTGGVRAASADVTGDGVPDIVVTPGAGGGPVVKVFDLAGNLLYSTMIFEETFRGGLNLALGDSANLGYAQITVGAGSGGGPRVSVIDAKNRSVLQNYFAGNAEERGGVAVSLVADSTTPTKLNLVAQTPTATNTYTGATGQPVSATSTATSPPATATPAATTGAGTTGTASSAGSTAGAASLRMMLASTDLSDPAAV